jgi:hypothetical protein
LRIEDGVGPYEDAKTGPNKSVQILRAVVQIRMVGDYQKTPAPSYPLFQARGKFWRQRLGWHLQNKDGVSAWEGITLGIKAG